MNQDRGAFLLFVVLLLAIVFCLACLIASEVCGDCRPHFFAEYGECDEALEVWGRQALFSVFEGPVWQDFTERDREVQIVVLVCHFFYECDDPELCMRVVVENPGWRGRRGDRAKVQWDPCRWYDRGDPDFKLVQLRTTFR